MGTPDFALPCLQALAGAGHEIACVYCQPPRPAERGQRPRPAPVQRQAEAAGWSVRTPSSLKGPAEQAAFAELGLDAAVVVAYGLILPQPILAAPRLGCLNLHASLLPRWRGAAPIQHSILAGDAETGVTIMQMDEGLDTGPILLQQARRIGPETTAATLHDDLAALGAKLMVEALDGLARGSLTARPQPEEGATYAAKLRRDDGHLDWRRPAEDLARQVRALDPWPGAFAELPLKGGLARVKVLAAEPIETAPAGEPGQVLDDTLTVACREGALRLARVQRPGRAAMAAADFLRGADLPAGTRLPLPKTPL